MAPDSLTPEQRSALMRRVRSKDTTPEIRVRRALHARGFRYRLHHPDLPGKPDLVLSRFRTCIFVHGCFWHGHEACKKASVPKTNTEFWVKKFSRNRDRDLKMRTLLEGIGWRVVTVWECQTEKAEEFERLLDEIVREISSS